MNLLMLLGILIVVLLIGVVGYWLAEMAPSERFKSGIRVATVVIALVYAAWAFGVPLPGINR